MNRIISTNKITTYFLLSTVYCLLSTLLIGCAGLSKGVPPPPRGMAGIYHQVKKGQTLWRISKAYGVEMDKVARINRLADSSRIYVGQLIFVPDASEKMEDLTLQADFRDRGGDFIWPLKGKVSSFFGMKKDKVKNKGICIQANRGAEVYASRSGKVVFCSDDLKGYSKIIIIDHNDGYSTVYAQNAKILARANQLVKQGQLIARAGCASGRDTPELYFEIRKGHKAQNPFFYLP